MSKNAELDKKILTFYEKQRATLSELGLHKKFVVNFESKKPTFVQRFLVAILSATGGFIDEQFSNITQ